MDFHIATARDAKHTLRSLGQTIVDRSLSGACSRLHTCADPRELPVLTQVNRHAAPYCVGCLVRSVGVLCACAVCAVCVYCDGLTAGLLRLYCGRSCSQLVWYQVYQ